MTSLEKFLNKVKDSTDKKTINISEPASGSFRCQNLECNEIVYEGYVDRVNSRIHWVCSQGHDSSVVI